MEHLVGLLQSVLGLTVRQGWTWLVAGVAVLMLNGYAVGPFAKLEPGWVAVAGVVAVFGAVILIVSFGSWLVGKAASRSKRRRTAKANQAEWNTANDEALRNVEILNRAEQEALAWIIRNGQKRFRTDVLWNLDGNLVSKRIVIGPLGHTSDVYEVIDGVWEIRGDLLKRYVGFRTEADPPWTPYTVGRY